jgi:VIT1/CCC1 family predicted Fe2+/Mn2+ transporter
VASAHGSHLNILIAGVSGLVAGAMSMAAGEYVSVSSQYDSEQADVAREQKELTENHGGELRELAGIYIKRGLNKSLAPEVATQLMAHDALGAHTRDELGFSSANTARPVQAALTSAASFAVGAALPLAMAMATPDRFAIASVSLASLAFLALLGVVGAIAGGASPLKAAMRVTFWGALAMAITAGIGAVVGTQV